MRLDFRMSPVVPVHVPPRVFSEGRRAPAGYERENQCHGTVNVMYRHRHTVHLTTFFFCPRENIFHLWPYCNSLFVRKRQVSKNKTKQKHLYANKLCGNCPLGAAGRREFWFPVNIFFNLLHCYASLIQFELLISTETKVLCCWFFLSSPTVICIICELSGSYAKKSNCFIIHCLLIGTVNYYHYYYY